MAKAKKTSSGESSVALIIALIFFILTTITFGVMWYLSFAEIEAKTKAVADAENAKKPLREAAREAELKARVYRVWLGLQIDGVTDDKSTIAAEARGNDVASLELDKINAAYAKLGSVPEDMRRDIKLWTTDGSKKAQDPTKVEVVGLLDQLAKFRGKEVAYEEAQRQSDNYVKQIDEMKKTITDLTKSKKFFDDEVKKMPDKFQNEVAKLTKEANERHKAFDAGQDRLRNDLKQALEDKDQLETKKKNLEEQLAAATKDNKKLRSEFDKSRKKDEFAYDEPQGKILKKLPEGVVEISIGSAANVKPGLTFTVLPPDYPEKGRQSRIRQLRVPDGKGGYKSVESFVPKGAIEVYEVVGPNLSLARVQAGSELDPIRDGVAFGDLIYNSAWRKGVADHVALIGIFDVNGDGIDDIESVVKDLTKMGIPVDAYFDMKKRAWVGEATERTRFIVQGHRPIVTIGDPNRDEKSRLIQSINDAVKNAQAKGVESTSFQSFFSHMGYKFRLDVTEDKINQATAPYLSNVGIGQPPVPSQQNNN